MVNQKSDKLTTVDQPNATDNNDRLPLLNFFNMGSAPQSSSGGFVGALIIGSVALVVALLALTIAIGRAPQSSPAAAADAESSQPPVVTTTYASPEPTGTRWTPEPIILGVPQKEAEPEETPTPTPKPSESDDEEDSSETPRGSDSRAESTSEATWGPIPVPVPRPTNT